MKAAAMSVWVFINLICFGMCGYLYLIWSQYWMYIAKQKLFNKSPEIPQKTISVSNYEDTYAEYKVPTNFSSLRLEPNKKNRRSAIAGLWGSQQITQPSIKFAGSIIRPSNNVVRKSQGSPRFPNIHTPILEFDSDKYICDEMDTSECEAQTREFKELLLKEFHRVLMGDSKVFKSGLDSHNSYNVKYKGDHRKEVTKQEVLCSLKRVQVRTVTSKDEPFRRLGFNIPGAPLLQSRAFNTCAVVTSAGALLGSRLGEFIDSHDMILRFNNAPTVNYTEDVGSKTTFRILNSQVVTKPEFKFLEDALYKDVSILIWDPANFSSSLEDWYRNPDFPLFPVYKRLLEERPDADVHLLRPQVLWDLWAVLQDASSYRLRRNPPSSGFIGIWLSLQRCKRVRVFEYVPSVRATRRCHYHVARDDTACTLGAWHPLAQEKALAERIRDNSDIDVFQKGYIDIPGLSNVDC
ncbi:beta-galactoside alpha-2,6-sialyltransferase 2 [Amyelois transitella]|uniref:beta-galactoside alpha-2,6-sialyltransferase 2 n=1 Tax=Amyelois transitella TaxID=680683 RepID=UPI00067D2169|nr:beta-galactoside alpha-2,6-sialyltransferase 2 [Amyelois transitella]